MSRSYSTDAIVMGSRRLGEADRIIDLFTAARGRVPAVAKSIRKVGSRIGGRLEPLSHITAQLHEGRNLHTVTGADTIATHAALRSTPACLKAGLSVVDFACRSTPELHPKPRTYNLFVNFLNQAESACPASGQSGGGDPEAAAPSIALATQLKMLLLAGFLPHLDNCAACGGSTELDSFSARVGGAVCSRCRRDAFPVLPESLAAMRQMLEKPLLASAQLSLSGRERIDIRRAVRELCEYHLGVRLRVEPW